MGRPKPLRSVQRQFWQLIAQGVTTAAACESLDVSNRAGSLWFRDAGGMPPLSLAPPTARFLTLPEREEIALGLASGKGIRAIAILIGRSPSTVSREVRRNRPRPGHDQSHQSYRCVLAQTKSEERARRPQVARLAANPQLRARVQAGLRLRWSPRQIAARFALRYPNDPEMWVSHETIYASLYVQGRGALRKDLTACLRTGRALRKPRKRVRGETHGKISKMISISQRPPEVADRAVPGRFHTPTEAMRDLLSGSAQPPGVVMTS
jgi:IS30 family transposase